MPIIKSPEIFLSSFFLHLFSPSLFYYNAQWKTIQLHQQRYHHHYPQQTKKSTGSQNKPKSCLQNSTLAICSSAIACHFSMYSTQHCWCLPSFCVHCRSLSAGFTSWSLRTTTTLTSQQQQEETTPQQLNNKKQSHLRWSRMKWTTCISGCSDAPSVSIRPTACAWSLAVISFVKIALPGNIVYIPTHTHTFVFTLSF